MSKHPVLFIKLLLLYPAFRQIRLKIAFAFYFSLILLGMIPGMRAQAGEYASGAVLHSLAYAIITYLIFTGMRSQSFIKAVQCLVLIALMGAMDEYIQSFFPYRNGSIDDWKVDMVAAISMIVCLLVTWPAIQKAIQQR